MLYWILANLPCLAAIFGTLCGAIFALTIILLSEGILS